MHAMLAASKWAGALSAEQFQRVRSAIFVRELQSVLRCDFMLIEQNCRPNHPRPARGRVILNSVNWPGSVSTSIVPPCCLTMMS